MNISLRCGLAFAETIFGLTLRLAKAEGKYRFFFAKQRAERVRFLFYGGFLWKTESP